MSTNLNRREFIKLSSLPPLTRLAALPSRPLQSDQAKNVLLILFDALTAQNISLYGYHRETMPNLARFAERATVYHNHIAGGNFTSSGTASLLTGTNAFTHRAYYSASKVEPAFEEKNLFTLFDQYYRFSYTQNQWVVILLYQFLKNIDLYKKSSELFINTSFISNLFPNDGDIASLSWFRWNSTADSSTKSSLFLPDFNRIIRKKVVESYSSEFPRGLPELRGLGQYILENAIDWLMEMLLQSPKPHLSYIHLLPPHSPYYTRREFIDVFEDGWSPAEKPLHFLSAGISKSELDLERRWYDEYILYVDAEFGRLVDWMEEHGVFEDTTLVFTSDHGEMFERGMLRHEPRVFMQPLVHIPLLIRTPGQNTRQDIYSPTNAIDLIPTLLQINGLEISPWLEGHVMPPFQAPAPVDRPFYAFDGREFSPGNRVKKGTGMLMRWPYKYMYYWGYQNIPNLGVRSELFNLDEDPEELDEISRSASEIAAELEGELKEIMRQSGRIAVPE